MSKRHSAAPSRREFIKSTVAVSAVALAAPAIATAKKTDGKVILGTGDYQYEVIHQWPQLPSKYSWQTTHDVAFDSEGLLYVIHEGKYDLKDHPTIFVFDQEGQYVRSFGQQFHGGGHGLDIRHESGQDFLYVCAYHQQRSFAKLDTRGELVWRKGAPMESGVYTEGEDKFPRSKSDNPWGRDRFIPTNIAFLPDGGFFLADGYGAYRVHRFDSDANWVSMFGQPGSDDDDRGGGKFNLPHGIWIDDRGAEPLVVVADRQFDRLQWFTLDGEHRRTQDGFLWPANLDTYEDLLLVPELVARVTLLGKNNEVLVHLGTDSERIVADKQESGKYAIRSDELRWRPGKFVHPHDACFDRHGNIFVAEWVGTGRVSKLRRL
ncbi:MAG: hypothetical protein IH898_09330 [Planctomycetes bacterium]|nr:hypothetical protein [Planctomycetota bacterium]